MPMSFAICACLYELYTGSHCLFEWRPRNNGWRKKEGDFTYAWKPRGRELTGLGKKDWKSFLLEAGCQREVLLDMVVVQGRCAGSVCSVHSLSEGVVVSIQGMVPRVDVLGLWIPCGSLVLGSMSLLWGVTFKVLSVASGAAHFGKYTVAAFRCMILWAQRTVKLQKGYHQPTHRLLRVRLNFEQYFMVPNILELHAKLEYRSQKMLLEESLWTESRAVITKCIRHLSCFLHRA